MTPVPSSWNGTRFVLGLGLLLGLAVEGFAQPTGRPIIGQATPTVVDTIPAHTIRFDHLTIADGLSQNAVYAIVQDNSGFLWFGTGDGLNRYDGYDFTVFRHIPFDSTSLSSSSITALFVDREGTLWIGTHNGGLNRYDREQARFHRYPAGATHPITAIMEDQRGDLWIAGNRGGLHRLRRDEVGTTRPTFDSFVHDPAAPHSLSSNRLGDVLVDRQGTVWVASQGGLDQFVPGSDEHPSGHFIRHPLNLDVPVGQEDVGATALLEDRKGRLWVGSASGVSLFRRDTKQFVHYRHRYHTNRYGWGTATDLLADRTGRLWIPTYAALILFDPASGQFSYLQHDPLAPQSLSNNSTTAIVQDRSEVVWVGTNGLGLNVYDPKADRFRTVRPPLGRSSRIAGFSVYTLFEDRDRQLWIDAGVLYRWDPDTGIFTSFETTADRWYDFGNTPIWSLVQAPNGDLWAGTERGLYRYTPATGRYRRYAHAPENPEGLPEPVVYGVYRGRNGALWTVTRNYLSRLADPATGRFTHYRYTDAPAATLWMFPSPHQDARGTFWLASRQGLIRIHPESGAVRRYRHDPDRPESLSHDVVRTIFPDPRRPEAVLWIGTAGGGLNRFEVESERFTHVTEADGLPNNVVYGILPDDDGRLWLSTNRGLARFDPETGAVKNYDVDDGLQSNEFNSGAYFRSESGTLFFGGLYGFNFFEPSAVTDNPHVPPVVLTGISLSNHPLSPGDTTALLEKDVVETEALTLSYRDNVITFTFAALDFSAPDNNRYAYLMEGFNDAWVNAGTANTATYTNLPPGQYTFRVKGSNNDGVWNETGTALALTITPPWWQTRWAYGTYAMIVIAGIFVADRVQRRRLIRREREHARLREAEIHTAAAERQSATLQHLDEMRARFFANVSHEFRTPLTLTIGPLDDLRRGAYGPLPDPARKQVDLARRNARSVLDLINELLDLSKIEAGKMTLRLQQADLAAFLRRVAATYESLAERQQVTFRCDVPEAPVMIAFDPDQLERVLANLLTNAFKFTPESGSVRLSLHDDDADPDTVVVRLRDTGPGIPADEINRIFDRFYQVSESSSRLQPGTGIGLALAWELVQLHRGTLQVESEEGFGSTFVMHLPREHPDRTVSAADASTSLDRSPREEAAPAPRDAPVDASPATAPAPDRPTVLVVEDNAEMRAYIGGHLSERYRVVEAANGRKGLSVAQRTRPDLVVSDVMMPGMDGYALCKALKQDPALDYVPVLLLTAKAESQDRLDGLAEGADAYLLKPFDLRELFAQIDNLLNSRKRLQERFGKTLPELHASEITIPSTDAAFLEHVRLVIEARLGSEDFSVEALADEVGLSRVHLYRRLRALIDRSPSELIRSIRLERAAQLLAQNAGAISEVAYGVGFKSVSHFSRVFREQYGQSPTEYAANTSADEEDDGRS